MAGRLQIQRISPETGQFTFLLFGLVSVDKSSKLLDTVSSLRDEYR